jgi:hypothetical protein
LNLGGDTRIKGIHPHSQREKIGVIQLQVFHVCQPFDKQSAVGSLDITGQVIVIDCCKPDDCLSAAQLFGQVENSPQQIGETVVFQQIGITEQALSRKPSWARTNLKI